MSLHTSRMRGSARMFFTGRESRFESGCAPAFSGTFSNKICGTVAIFKGSHWVRSISNTLEYYISDFLIFCSGHVSKSGERKKINFPGGPNRLCSLAGNSEGHRGKLIFFSFPTFAYMTRAKYQKIRNVIFKGYLKLI